VDGALSAALPNVPDATLLGLSRSAVRLTLAPGASLPVPEARQPQRVYVVSGGVLTPAVGSGSLLVKGTLIDPRREGRAARAGESGAELLALRRDEIAEYLVHAPGRTRTASRGPAAGWLRGWVRRKRGAP
jgi:hypothetical protein